VNGNNQSNGIQNSNLNNMYARNSPFIHINRLNNDAIFSHHPSGLEDLLMHLAQRMHEPRVNPLNENLVSSLPEITITDLSKIPAGKNECVICLTKYELNEKAILLPCTDMFHTECIKNWFKNQNSCPLCKFKINERTINGLN